VEGTDDDTLTEYEMHLIVGPWWRDVKVWVPFVTITGHLNTDSDEDDQQMWIVRDLKWTTDGEGAPTPARSASAWSSRSACRANIPGCAG
jgi:hypothetical protein